MKNLKRKIARKMLAVAITTSLVIVLSIQTFAALIIMPTANEIIDMVKDNTTDSIPFGDELIMDYFCDCLAGKQRHKAKTARS